MGKPSPGIMQAGFSFLGLFSECIDTTNDFFNGKYCLATISLPSSIHQMFQVGLKNFFFFERMTF